MSCLAVLAGGRFAAGSDDGAINAWDLHTGSLFATLIGHCGFVTALVATRGGAALISSGGDQTIRLWSLADGDEEKQEGGDDLEVAAARGQHCLPVGAAGRCEQVTRRLGRSLLDSATGSPAPRHCQWIPRSESSPVVRAGGVSEPWFAEAPFAGQKAGASGCRFALVCGAPFAGARELTPQGGPGPLCRVQRDSFFF